MLQFCDDFSSYGTQSNLMLNGLYAAVGNNDNARIVDDPDPNATGLVFNISGLMRRVLTADRTTVGMAFRLWMGTLPSGGDPIVACMLPDTGNFNIGNALRVTSVGKIQVYDSCGNNPNEGNILAQSAGPALIANAWNHIEWKMHFDAAAGTCEVRVNGLTVCATTALNTGVASVAQVGWANMDRLGVGGIQIKSDMYIKDIVTWDSAGARNNDFFGTVSVIGRTTNSDVTLGGWGLSTGANGYSLLANSPPVDGVDYITADDAPPAACKFGLTALPPDVTSVRALVTQIRCAKTDGGDGTIQAGLISSGDTDTGADRPITTAFTYYEDIFETDPHTAAAWSPAAADAAELQIDRTT